MKAYEITFKNHFQTGAVDVKVEQYEITDDGETQSMPGEVMPNQDVSYIPRVTNLRAPSYVRVKVEIDMEQNITKPITLEQVVSLNEDWVQCGEYFYLTKPLKTNESSDLFSGFHVPEEWTQDTACGFQVKVTVDALQNVQFVPDFQSASPWGSIEIEQAKEEDHIVYGIAKQIEASPVFQYTAQKGFESSTMDLFKNFDYFMAGNSYKDNLTMKNDAECPVQIYFKTETAKGFLVDQMQLRITCAGTVIYEGSLYSESLNSYHYLTEIEAGESEKLEFEVKLPEDSKNSYSVLNEDVVWKFKCREMHIDMQEVQTGDETSICILFAIMISATTVMCLYLWKRKRVSDD